MASGDTKTEALLNILGNGGTGDEFRGCCNTKTQNYILDAIDRINALDPSSGGAFKALSASDVTGKDPDGNDIIELWKLPSGIYTFDIGEDDGYYIVTNTLYDEEADIYFPSDWNFTGTGIVEISSADSDASFYTVLASDGVVTFYSANRFGFVNFDNIYPASAPFAGADSSTDGIAGLVPAPTTSDVGKFLKSDGTWQEAGGGVEYVDLTITGLNQDGSINVLAAKKNSEVISLAQNNIKVIFRMTIPSGAGVPMGSGTYELPLFNYDQPYYAIAMSVISLSGTLMSINFYYDSNNDTQNGVVSVSTI